MNKILTSSALAVFAIAAAPALATEPMTMTRDGITYRYTVEQRGDAQIIKGNTGKGETFRLRVAGGRVDGRMGFRQVSFPVKEAFSGDARISGTKIVSR